MAERGPKRLKTLTVIHHVELSDIVHLHHATSHVSPPPTVREATPRDRAQSRRPATASPRPSAPSPRALHGLFLR